MAIDDFELSGETDTLFSLSELCERCGVHAEFIVEMIEYGIVAPVTADRQRFSATALLRVHRARRLQRDLELNLPGLALGLDLLDEIAALRSEVAALRHRLRQLGE